MSDPLVSTEWLHERLGAPDIKIIDATWYLPGDERDPKADYALAHIPGAVFFDIEEIADLNSPMPHMLPPPEKFASRVKKMGLGDGSTIVVYDASGIFSAPRVWWMFRAMGHERVMVLDGGLPKWIAEGRPIEDMPPATQERHFTPRYTSDLVRDLDQVRKTLESGREQVVDARAAARFTGEAPEPRPGLRGGHMPGSLNVPSSTLIAPDGTMKSAEQLADVFELAGVDVNKRVVATCGSGISASIVALALARLGHPRTAVYDGSWTEWGGREDTPVVTGAA
jgi:thiosulfate/3-mercaptopyruvate sulfurtransferase